MPLLSLFFMLRVKGKDGINWDPKSQGELQFLGPWVPSLEGGEFNIYRDGAWKRDLAFTGIMLGIVMSAFLSTPTLNGDGFLKEEGLKIRLSHLLSRKENEPGRTLGGCVSFCLGPLGIKHVATTRPRPSWALDPLGPRGDVGNPRKRQRDAVWMEC